MSLSRKPAKELWAVLNKDREVMYSRGGSSTKPRLLVYPTQKAAQRALASNWTKQVIDAKDVTVEKIYPIKLMPHKDITDIIIVGLEEV